MVRIVLYLLIFNGVTGYQKSEGTVVVEVTNLESRDGNMLLSVYNSEEGFPGKAEKAYLTTEIPITKNACKLRLSLPAGTYAISIAHDINGNGEIDTNFIGIPKEPLGMSNYPKMAKPKFDKAKFEVKAGEEIRLEIPVDTIF